jgi:LAO/AO transport system kinase
VEAAGLTQAQYQSALRLLGRGAGREPQALTCSARERINVDTVWRLTESSLAVDRATGALADRRCRQNAAWFRKLLQERLTRRLRTDPAVEALLPELERSVAAGEITAMAAVGRIDALL